MKQIKSEHAIKFPAEFVEQHNKNVDALMDKMKKEIESSMFGVRV